MTSKQLTIINSFLEIIKKSLINYIIYKALPVGHVSHRSTGDWKKVSANQWVKVKVKGKEKGKNIIENAINKLDKEIKEFDEGIKEKKIKGEDSTNLKNAQKKLIEKKKELSRQLSQKAALKKRVKDRTMEKDPYANLPKDLKQLPKRQENAIVNSLKKEFNKNELKTRSKNIDKLIKEKEKAFKKTVNRLTKRGINPAKIKNVELDNLKRARAIHQKAIGDIKKENDKKI